MIKSFYIHHNFERYDTQHVICFTLHLSNIHVILSYRKCVIYSYPFLTADFRPFPISGDNIYTDQIRGWFSMNTKNKKNIFFSVPPKKSDNIYFSSAKIIPATIIHFAPDNVQTPEHIFKICIYLVKILIFQIRKNFHLFT